MRITGGRARGIPLLLPKGDAVRPATDAMRQAVFSSLAARIEGARFIDLFAGSGGYGLEALSRGAATGVFVEKDARTAAYLRRNWDAVAKSLGRSPDEAQIITADATKAGFAPMPDLVFIDPPYTIITDVAPVIFSRLQEALAKEGQRDVIVVFEMPGEIELSPAGWSCVKRLGKGGRQPTAAFFRPDPGAP